MNVTDTRPIAGNSIFGILTLCIHLPKLHHTVQYIMPLAHAWYQRIPKATYIALLQCSLAAGLDLSFIVSYLHSFTHYRRVAFTSTVKPGFHYPSWRPELTARVDGWPVSVTRQHGPCWRARVFTSRVDGPSTRVVETGLNCSCTVIEVKLPGGFEDMRVNLALSLSQLKNGQGLSECLLIRERLVCTQTHHFCL